MRVGGGVVIGIFLSLAWPTNAEAQRGRVRVSVVDQTTEVSYLSPGSGGGVERGAQVRIGRRSYQVVAATESYAVIENGENPPSLGARGTAQRERGGGAEEETAEGLAPVRPLSDFEDQWPEPSRPALSQDPDFVPLAAGVGARRVALLVNSNTSVFAPLGADRSTLVRTQLRARVHAQPFDAVPLAIDADAALTLYFAGDLEERRGDSSRPIVEVRQLELSYGEDREFFAALGRLRYAARTVGMLDGLRVRSPALSGLTVGAFGGMVPDPVSGAPAFDASRFGAEIEYLDATSPARPHVSLVAQGSTFDGSIDERRISGSVRVLPGDFGTGGYFEVSLFDEDNRWGVSTLELSAAGLDLSGRHGAFRWGLRGDYRHPERSEWLAAHFDPGYLCVGPRQTATSTEMEPCAVGDDARYSGSGDVELRGDSAAVAAGATFTKVPLSGVEQLAAFGQVRALNVLGFARGDATVHMTRGSLLDSYSLRLGVGASLLEDQLDISVHYRPSLRYYRIDFDVSLDHMAGAEIYTSWSPEWQIALAADVLFGDDTEAVLVQTSVTYRPDLAGN